MAWLFRFGRESVTVRSLDDIEYDPDIRQTAKVLAALERRGLREPAVASGFIRTRLLGVPPTDVDIHYVGGVPTATAERWLHEILTDSGIDPHDWDIWNFTEHDPLIHTVAYGYRAHFVSTIDCVYLAADRRLHDLTGRGEADARDHILSLTHPTVTDYPYAPGQICYLCLEGCRRMFLYGLSPTPETAVALRDGAACWWKSESRDRAYLRQRIREKLTEAQREVARALYEAYGWGTIFEAGED